MKITRITDTDLSHWYPGTQHFRCEDGRYIAIHADQHICTDALRRTVHGKPAVKRGVHLIVLTPTVILWCDQNAVAENLTAAWQFDPGTTVVDALTAAGFELEG